MLSLPIDAETVRRLRSTSRPSGSGASRNVYDLGTAVLKVDKPGEEWAGTCVNEIRVWEASANNPELRALLCPIIAADTAGKWLIMLKCEPLDEEEFETSGFANEIAQYGIGDMHPLNAMLHPETGRIVAVDYAYSTGNYDDDEYDDGICSCSICRTDAPFEL